MKNPVDIIKENDWRIFYIIGLLGIYVWKQKDIKSYTLTGDYAYGALGLTGFCMISIYFISRFYKERKPLVCVYHMDGHWNCDLIAYIPNWGDPKDGEKFQIIGCKDSPYQTHEYDFGNEPSEIFYARGMGASAILGTTMTLNDGTVGAYPLSLVHLKKIGEIKKKLKSKSKEIDSIGRDVVIDSADINLHELDDDLANFMERYDSEAQKKFKKTGEGIKKLEKVCIKLEKYGSILSENETDTIMVMEKIFKSRYVGGYQRNEDMITVLKNWQAGIFDDMGEPMQLVMNFGKSWATFINYVKGSGLSDEELNKGLAQKLQLEEEGSDESK